MRSPQEGISVAAGGVTAAASGVLGWLALLGWRATGREYPQLPWLGLIPMTLYVVLVLVAAWRIRQYVRAPRATSSRTVAPTVQQARGTLVAAQAGALAGAVLVGFYLANAAVHLSTLDVPSVRELFVRAVVSALAAACVSAAGYVGQWMCRLPEDDDEPPPPGGEDGMAYG
ncbi:MAG: DUF3180 family protein [Ornithinimicrobium sp.]